MHVITATCIALALYVEWDINAIFQYLNGIILIIETAC